MPKLSNTHDAYFKELKKSYLLGCISEDLFEEVLTGELDRMTINEKRVIFKKLKNAYRKNQIGSELVVRILNRELMKLNN